MLIDIQCGKGGRDRYVPLSTTLLETLRVYWRWMTPKTWLFPGTIAGLARRQAITPKVVWETYRTAAAREVIEQRVSARVQRHSSATNLLETTFSCNSVVCGSRGALSSLFELLS